MRPGRSSSPASPPASPSSAPICSETPYATPWTRVSAAREVAIKLPGGVVRDVLAAQRRRWGAPGNSARRRGDAANSIAMLALELLEERAIDLVGSQRAEAEFKVLKHVDEFLAIYQLDRWNTIA